jgi:hypothetical protein
MMTHIREVLFVRDREMGDGGVDEASVELSKGRVIRAQS